MENGIESSNFSLPAPLYTLHSPLSSLHSTLHSSHSSDPSPHPLLPMPLCQSQCPFPFSFCSARSTRSRRGEWTQGDAVVVVAVAAGVAAAVSVSQLNLRAKNVPLFCRSWLCFGDADRSDRQRKRESNEGACIGIAGRGTDTDDARSGRKRNRSAAPDAVRATPLDDLPLSLTLLPLA